MVRAVLIVLFTLFFIPCIFGQNRTEVFIDNIENSKAHHQIQKAAGDLLTEANRAHKNGEIISFTGIPATGESKNRTLDIWSSAPFRCSKVKLNLNILKVPGGRYQLRNIPVTAGSGSDSEKEELILNFNEQGELEDVYFGIEDRRYKDLIASGQTLEDFRRRQMILDFLENFRTAYNRKDPEMLEMMFSDNALIIVGKVVEKSERGIDGKALLGAKKVELIKLNKEQYLSNLKAVFEHNSFIRVNFEDIEIMQHGMRTEIYGVNLKQHWKSGNYSDEGYLFLMIDFEDEAQPLIHVRSWQPEKETATSEVIELGDFDIVK